VKHFFATRGCWCESFVDFSWDQGIAVAADRCNRGLHAPLASEDSWKGITLILAQGKNRESMVLYPKTCTADDLDNAGVVDSQSQTAGHHGGGADRRAA
jgi:hypothetical protein